MIISSQWKVFKFFLLFFLGSFFYSVLNAQELTIDTIIIEDSRIATEEKLDSSSFLKNKLNRVAGVYFRAATPGQSSTATLMGSSASQIPIVWNDIPINNRMVGVMDFSLLPMYFFQNSYLSHTTVGNASSIGSTIHLEDQGINNSIHVGINSLSNLEMGIQFGQKQKRWEHQVKIYGFDAQNDYSVNINGISNKAFNNENRFFAILYNNAFSYQNWKVSSSAWMQQMDRKIPTAMNSQSYSKQYDKNARYQIQAENQLNQYQKLSLQVAYLYDEILFQNGFINDLGIVDQKIGRINHRFNRNRFIIENEYLHTFATANHPEYRGTEGIQNEIRTDHLIQYITESFGETTLGISNIWNNGVFAANPYLMWIMNRNLWQMQVKVAKNSRFPSLNDLYWAQGGNLDLLPERSYSVNGSVSFGIRESFLKMGFFYKDVDQWIQWLPDETNIWRAQNQLKVISKGFSIEGNYRFTNSILKDWELYGSYQFSSTQNRDNNSPNFGKQLIYHPLHQAKASLIIPFSTWNIKFDNQYCSQRYTSSDNSLYLNAFVIHDIILTKKITTNTEKIQLFVAVRNFTNQKYQLSSGFYQPGVHGDIKLKFYFHE